MLKIAEKHIKIGVGTAENAAQALFLCPKKPKTPVYICSLYAVAKNEQKVRAGGFEPSKSWLSKE